MSNIVINVDTEKQTIKVSVNEKNIPDIRDITVSKYIPYDEKEEKVIVDIVSGTTDEENNIRKTIITTCIGNEVKENHTLVDDIIKALKI